jgi:uncharacterized protein (DUF1684 family)
MRFFLTIVLLTFVSFAFSQRRQRVTHSLAPWQRELIEWRAHHATELVKPDGWFALVGLEWLQVGDNSIGSAVDNKIHLPTSAAPHLGVLHLENNVVSISPPPEGFPNDLLIDGQPAQKRTLPTGVDSDKDNPRLRIGSLEMYVIKRADRYGLRIKDSKSAALIGFHGLKWFAPNEKYRVTARWIPYDPPRTTTLSTLIGTRYSQPVPGAAEFELEGKRYRLEPVIEDPAEQKLFFIIRDTTSKTSTYGACRFLYTPYPSKGLKESGELVLDFNRLENPPCAYTSFATCPLPPAGNRLPIPIPAGEKRYHY